MASKSLMRGMQRVPLAQKTLDAYVPIVGADIIAELEVLARPLRGARVAHVSATAQGGGVAELLRTLVPLMCNAGLDAEWYVISGTEAFFTGTKTLHNALQGMPLALTSDMQALYLDVNRANAASFGDEFDFIVVHDPQPAPLRALRAGARGKWIWRSHIDLTAPTAQSWDFLRPFLQAYDAAIFTMPEFVPPDLTATTVAFIPPAIDPLSPKNAALPDDTVRRLIGGRGVDPVRPLLVQVSRFDPWKDPLGVIDVYRVVRQQVGGIQLVLLGALAHDDPEGSHYYELTCAHADGDPDVHVLLNTHGEREVNAFQRHASVILQKSLREGFGLTVTEGLWKARPVIASKVGGIPLQIDNGITGYLVESVEQAAECVLGVLREPAAAAAVSQRGREVVRGKFLSTAYLGNYLRLLNQLKG